MKDVKILQVATYPLVKPLHGGQIRVSQIRDKLLAMGGDVKSISFSEPSHNYFDDNDFVLDPGELVKNISTPYSSDLATANVIATCKRCKDFFLKAIDGFTPNFIFLEQCWAWPLVKSILEERKIEAKIVYSSQNVESLAKESIFKSNNISDELGVVQAVRDIELDLIRSADCIIACTDNDKIYYSGFTDKDVIVAPNGVERVELDCSVLERVSSALCGRKFALLVGSAYPPNAQGFWEVLGDNMAWLKPDEILVAVGGVSNIIESFMPSSGKINEIVNFDRIKRLGFVEKDELRALLELASVIILPITSGGGSNLKTAEAILSCKPVVATEMACRGFHDVNNYTNFSVCESKKDFISQVKKFMREPIDILTEQEKEAREHVTWENALCSLENLFK